MFYPAVFYSKICADKELWEPTLETLFSLRNGRDPPTNVREAWALDWQSHGDSAVLNASALKARREGLSTHIQLIEGTPR